MTRFFSSKYEKLKPYVPGEQPKDMKYVKLNTNESPFPPSKKAQEAAAIAAQKVQLYSDPECKDLVEALGKLTGLSKECIIPGNGSDENLNYCFMAFCDENTPAIFADITYGFYPVFAQINNLPYKEIPLKEDFTIDPKDYYNAGGTVFIANPNAPTGIALTLDQIEDIVKNNPNNIVVIDEAYVDFGATSAIPLTKKYSNLVVTQTFSKSRSLAGARLGFAVACPELIKDLNTIKYSLNPYNVNSMTMAAGIGVLADEEYTKANCKTIQENRAWTIDQLRSLGFDVLESKANFIFAKSNKIDGEQLYLKLKEKGVLVRHFTKERISQYNRITIGNKEQMEIFINLVKEILGE